MGPRAVSFVERFIYYTVSLFFRDSTVFQILRVLEATCNSHPVFKGSNMHCMNIFASRMH